MFLRVVVLLALIVSTTHALGGQNNKATRPPSALISAIKKAILSSSWNQTADGPLGSEFYLTLNNGKLLLFLQIPNYLGGNSNMALPTTIDLRGTWKWGEPIEGVVEKAVITEDGNIWISSQWAIEGTYPLLYCSKNGTTWQRIGLPEPRLTQGFDETLIKLCMHDQKLEISLTSEQAHGKPIQQLWDRPLSTSGNWSAKTQPSKNCTVNKKTFLCSREDSNAKEVVFHCGNRTVAVPKYFQPPLPKH